MNKVKLKSGRMVEIRDLTMDQIADLSDIPEIVFKDGIVSNIRNMNKAKLAWLRAGIGGGDFDNWKPNGVAPPDSVLKQLTEIEKDELVEQIKAAQYTTKKKSSSSA